ncbi:MAG TPA: DMT family transporter, partial [Sphingobacteriaceae bacterium]
MRSKEFQWVIAGVLFSLLWASASSATKIGLDAAQPLFIAVLRFGIASVIMLAYAHMAKGYSLPAGREWVDIAVYGLLNISIYLGCYVFAMQEVTASIGAIATATNPVFISLMSVFFLKKRLTWNVILSLMICIAGVFCA